MKEHDVREFPADTKEVIVGILNTYVSEGWSVVSLYPHPENPQVREVILEREARD